MVRLDDDRFSNAGISISTLKWPELETMARDAEKLTRQNFGRTMRLFAPLYLSNECVNICKYCGFSRDNPILRVTLSLDQVEAEARHLYDQGFRNILLVAGEHPKFVAPDYLARCVERLKNFIPALSLEVGPMETPVCFMAMFRDPDGSKLTIHHRKEGASYG